MKVYIEPWREGQSSIYAIVRECVCLIDRFFDELEEYGEKHAIDLASFIKMITEEPYIRPGFLRPELPNHGIYAMYSEKTAKIPYNPSRLLCGYVGTSDRILLVGAGFVKDYTGSIQDNPLGNGEALFLAEIIKQANGRVDHGEIEIVGSSLIPRYADSLHFDT
ncbi:MAG: hypothetical protein FGM32_10910 [Candidatus Kapabacteria bacterium]|nr:hypothetical protein [Candidatus Kapabacteria bacterium]